MLLPEPEGVFTSTAESAAEASVVFERLRMESRIMLGTVSWFERSTTAESGAEAIVLSDLERCEGRGSGLLRYVLNLPFGALGCEGELRGMATGSDSVSSIISVALYKGVLVATIGCELGLFQGL